MADPEQMWVIPAQPGFTVWLVDDRKWNSKEEDDEVLKPDYDPLFGPLPVIAWRVELRRAELAPNPRDRRHRFFNTYPMTPDDLSEDQEYVLEMSNGEATLPDDTTFPNLEAARAYLRADAVREIQAKREERGDDD